MWRVVVRCGREARGEALGSYFRRGVRGSAAGHGVAGAATAVLEEGVDGRTTLRAFKQHPGSVGLAVAVVECLPEEGRRTLAAVLLGEGYGRAPLTTTAPRRPWAGPGPSASQAEAHAPEALRAELLAGVVDAKAEAFVEMDANGDGVVTEAEFEAYVARRVEEAREERRPEWRQLASYMAIRGIPMVGFGFLDNAIMLVAGEGVELMLGSALGLSTLGAAAIGNMFSDVVGLGAGGVIEQYAERLGIPPHRMSPAQLRRADVTRLGMAASVVGISIGCILGMAPLLFMPDVGHGGGSVPTSAAGALALA